MRLRPAAVVALAGLLAAAPLAAQEPRPEPRPLPVRPDTSRAAPDTLRPPPGPEPPTAADTIPVPGPRTPVEDSSGLDSVRWLMPPLGPPPGPAPTSRRIVLDKDDIRFSGALSLGELLRQLPGVTLVRPGWFGMPETVFLEGQGGAAVEIDWDGFPIDPLGPDSAGFDLGRFQLALLSRIEIEMLPTVLRVHLVSEMPALRRARSEVSFQTGDVQTNAYQVRYLNRWGSGLGLGMGVTYFGTDGPPYSNADVGELGLWLRGGYVTGDRLGIEYEMIGYGLERDDLTATSGGVLPGADVRRRDSFVRAFASSRPGGTGWRVDALLGTSSYSDTSGALDTAVTGTSLAAAWRGEREALELSARVRDGSRPFELSLRGSWSPLRRLTLSGSARRSWPLGRETMTDADLGGELQLLGPVRLSGDVRWRRLDDTLQAPADSLRRVLDWAGGVGVSTRAVSVRLAYRHHGAFEATMYGALAGAIPALPAGEGSSLTLSWAVRPTSYLTLHGWYRDPVSGDETALEPPHHAVTMLTFRSRFLPHFRRGVFDVMGRLEVESWSAGSAGLDSTGAPIELRGNSVWSAHVQFRLVGAIIFWTWRNTQLRRYFLVPGLDMPRSLQRFGIMWEFTN